MGGEDELTVYQRMHVATGLLLHRGDQGGVIVTEYTYADSGDEVQVVFSLRIGQVAALTTGYFQSHGGGAGLGYVSQEVGAIHYTGLAIRSTAR